MLTLLVRLSQLYQQGQATMGQIAMCKAHCTLTARRVCAVAREIVGGNGILLEQRVMKQMLDLEGVHTYEGTYEINGLVAGREITGKAAFK